MNNSVNIILIPVRRVSAVTVVSTTVVSQASDSNVSNDGSVCSVLNDLNVGDHALGTYFITG